MLYAKAEGSRTIGQHLIIIILLVSLLILALSSLTSFIKYPDWESYELIYYGTSENTIGLDFLFKGLIHISKMFFLPYKYFRFLCAAIVMVFFSISLRGLGWKEQIGLILLNYIFLSCQIRQGILLSLLYVLYLDRRSLMNKFKIFLISFFHVKSYLMLITYNAYMKMHTVLKIFLFVVTSYLLINLSKIIFLVPLFDEYSFHFQVDLNEFSLFSLITPILYLVLFRSASVSDRIVVLMPIIIILYSILFYNVVGGRIVINSLMRIIPVIFSLRVFKGKVNLRNIDLLVIGAILIKDFYSSQL